MKIRNGFVSNSSSSSFIVFGKKPDKSNTYNDNKLSDDCFEKIKFYGKDARILRLPLKNSNLEFGWEFERYYSLGDKINFVAIQLMQTYGTREYWERVSIFEHALCDVLGNYDLFIRYDYNSVLSEGLTSDDSSIYVDHQSSIGEGENTEIFDSIEAMKEFLFDSDSYIQGGNDNDDYGNYPDYMESLGKRYPREELKENYPEYFKEEK